MDDLLPDGPKRFYQDEPMRAWRAAERNREDRFDITRMDPRRAASHAEHYLRAARYTHHQFWYLELAHDALGIAGRKPEAVRLMEENRERFIGNYLRDRFFAKRARLAGDTAAEGSMLAAAVRARPDLWSNFDELASAQLRQYDERAAQQTLLSFPDFRDHTDMSFEAGASACNGAATLERAGESTLASPLFEICARSHRSSYWHWFAKMRLALARGDYRQALALSSYLSRNDGVNSRRDLITTATLHFLLAEPDAGWKAVSEMAKVLDEAEPLATAFVGHRIQGGTDEQLLQYAAQWTRPGSSQFIALLIEFRGIGRQECDGDLAVLGFEPLTHLAALVATHSIPDHQQLSSDRAPQGAEELDDLLALHRASEEAKVETPPRQCGNSRHLLPREALLDDRSVSAQAPASRNRALLR